MAPIYDVIVVGGGPAGLTAAIYAGRKLLRTLVLTQDIGGQLLLTAYIENFPGYTGYIGMGLAETMGEQAKRFGAEIVIGEVTRIDKADGSFRVSSSAGDFEGRAVIVTGGSVHRKLGVPGEERLLGRGVSVCATCDGPFARGRTVALIGGGNAALQSAVFLSKLASKVYVIHRRDQFRGDGVLVDEVGCLKNVETLLGTIVTEITGEKKVEGLRLKDAKTGEVTDLRVEMVFIEVGRDVKLDYAKHLFTTNSHGQVVTDKEGRTSCEGIFAAGDITDLPWGQAVIAAGAGATAALSAYEYLQRRKSAGCRY